MGVVIKQSFWGTALGYLGVLIGFVNTLYLRPEFFLVEEIGVFGIITANAMMISPFTTFGMSSSYIRFFSGFQEKDRNSVFTFQFLIVITGCCVMLLLGFLLKDVIAKRYIDSAPEYVDHLVVTAVIIVVNSLFEMFFSYSQTRLRVLFPSFIRDVFLRIGSIFLVIGFAAGWFDFDSAIRGLAVNYLLALILMIGKSMLIDKFRFSFQFSFVSDEWKKRLFNFSIYSMFLAGSFAVMNNASYDLVISMLGADANGIFVTCFFIGTIVEMPRRNMSKVITPILATEMENKNLEEVKNLYKRSSITMSVIGSILFIGIVSNLQDLFLFIPQGDKFATGTSIVIFVCLAKLIIMFSSFPGEIINYSKNYRYNLAFQLGTAILLVCLNYLTIPVWGLYGAGISYFISISAHAIVKVIYVRYYLKMYPFVKSHSQLLIIGFLTGVAAYSISFDFHPIINILIRSILTAATFVFFIYQFRISSDINKLINSTFERFKKIKGA